jgi:hypothetical protein
VKRRWKVVLGAGGLLLAAALAPILYVETACKSPLPGLNPGGYRAVSSDPAWRRQESRTWLTYPEWHIVYSAESYARHVRTQPPSGYHYWRDIRGFWSGYCAVNRAAAGQAGLDARVMLYTIGLSYSAELLAKGAYENSLGRLSEWVGGWHSADDRYAQQVQQRYGAFMHETPWYEFPFGQAFAGLWKTSEPSAHFRHWERRFALSGEYGAKAGYAKLIGWASGASLGRDERTLRFVAVADAQTLTAVDPRLRAVRTIGKTKLVVEAPRYAQFSELLTKLSTTGVELVEISGNDDIFVTVLMPPGRSPPKRATRLFGTALDEPAGWQRVGLATKVPDLLAFIRSTRASGGYVEHVYDY